MKDPKHQVWRCSPIPIFFFPCGGAIVTDLHVLQRIFILPKTKGKGYMECKYCYPSYPNGRK